MLIYLLKRLAAIVPTLLGVLTITFMVTQFVPGGPVDHMLTQIDGADVRSGGEAESSGGWSYSGRSGIDAKQISQLTQLYGFDRPPFERYWQMLKNFALYYGAQEWVIGTWWDSTAQDVGREYFMPAVPRAGVAFGDAPRYRTISHDSAR